MTLLDLFLNVIFILTLGMFIGWLMSGSPEPREASAAPDQSTMIQRDGKTSMLAPRQ